MPLALVPPLPVGEGARGRGQWRASETPPGLSATLPGAGRARASVRGGWRRLLALPLALVPPLRVGEGARGRGQWQPARLAGVLWQNGAGAEDAFQLLV